jgi:hypothetical protein
MLVFWLATGRFYSVASTVAHLHAALATARSLA